jgi:hypothetical protein
MVTPKTLCNKTVLHTSLLQSMTRNILPQNTDAKQNLNVYTYVVNQQKAER